MTEQLKNIYKFFNKIFIANSNIPIRGNKFYKARFKVGIGNKVIFQNSLFESVRFKITGNNNYVLVKNSLVSSSINISGNNNTLILENGVKLRGTIHLRGNNCTILIGEGTTTGGVRIVNAGNHNTVEIGKNCMFSDNIEIWASDTHSILNKSGEVINKEKPIKIGDNVWVGSHVIILKGVEIGNFSVIGMGTIVTKDIPSNTVSVGNPNKVLKTEVTWKRKY